MRTRRAAVHARVDKGWLTSHQMVPRVPAFGRYMYATLSYRQNTPGCVRCTKTCAIALEDRSEEEGGDHKRIARGSFAKCIFG